MKSKIKHEPKEISKIDTTNLIFNSRLIDYIHYKNKKLSKAYSIAKKITKPNINT